jgi:tRNA (guanine-N(7)-)-methyltransferase subunit TRM82
MKQLLSSYGENILVGLNKNAYLFGGQSNRVTELVKPASAENEGGKKSKPDDLDDIQAVALVQDKADSSNIWCAVSRGDKTLAIYKLNENEARPTVDCSLVYNSPKRVGHLCFTEIPGTNQLCLVSGDLAGDVYAYSLVEKGRRLLLGHTASMLTGIFVLGNQLLTADRDEKIRVSSFPETYVTEGYLLGHEAYVTSMDAIILKSDFKLVASCSGDGTVQLWDIETFQPISKVSTNDESDEEKTSTDLIPSDITMHPEGKMATVIFDSSKRMDTYAIEVNDSSGKPKLGKLIQSCECAETPLSVIFQSNDTLLVLMQSPQYLVPYKMVDGKFEPQNDSIGKIREVAKKNNIVMQETILERDAYGNIKLRKLNETRGPSGDDAPWNRIERVGIAKERQKRHKKRKFEKNKDAKRKENETK